MHQGRHTASGKRRCLLKGNKTGLLIFIIHKIYITKAGNIIWAFIDLFINKLSVSNL